MNTDESPVSDASRQAREHEDRLRDTPVEATSHKNIVKVILNGLGDGIEMRFKPNATRQYAHDSMGELVTSALQAGDRAVEAVALHAFGSITAGDDTVDGWNSHRDSAASTVAECFSGTPQANRVVRSRKHDG
ncbi:MAG TPA: YbaB/EbfC family nucleoid-associated protein [Candidatus Stackebrandtia faecavium]|nr:YbaB/EbfC family nucleoid-associated protein [Candidatus Stackebrandtia faecavium]